MSKKLTLSPVRKFMMWVFGAPSNDPYVQVNLDFEFDNSFKFLEKYNEKSSCKISIHHLLIKILADCFALHPRLNVKIFGNDEIYQLDCVNIATPINLVDSKWSPNFNELGIAIIRNADQKSLEEISLEISHTVKTYKKGGSVLFIEEIAKFFYHYLPNVSLKLLFKSVSIFGRHRLLYNMIQDLMGVSTLFTNVGSVIKPMPGIHYKSLGFTLPDTLVHFSACFGAGPIGKKTVVQDDQIVIRSLMPFLIIFDHRIVDGFLMNHFVEDFAKRLYSPEKYYSLEKKTEEKKTETQKNVEKVTEVQKNVEKPIEIQKIAPESVCLNPENDKELKQKNNQELKKTATELSEKEISKNVVINENRPESKNGTAQS